MQEFSVKQLAQLAGVSVRTLHVYDQKGLLKPAYRTEAKYRWYGRKELLRLQQILFYKELDFSLQEIADIINAPDFDVLKALESHRKAIYERQNRLNSLLNTIDETINALKINNQTMNLEQLYAGFPKEKAQAYRAEAIEQWGQEAVENSENYLVKMTKPAFMDLKNAQEQLGKTLFKLHTTVAPTSPEIQTLIAKHYDIITLFWGRKPSAENYIGLSELYINDDRYTLQNDLPQPAFAQFLGQAMRHFAQINLK